MHSVKFAEAKLCDNYDNLGYFSAGSKVLIVKESGSEL